MNERPAPTLSADVALLAGAVCDWSTGTISCADPRGNHPDRRLARLDRTEKEIMISGFADDRATATPDEAVTRNLGLMKRADDDFNARNYQGFLDERHHPAVVVHQTGLPAASRTLAEHRREIETLIRAFPDVHVHNDPYDIAFGQGEWTTAIGRLTGTFTGELTTPDGDRIPPTGRSFDVTFTTIARWRDDRIVEERVLWDGALLAQQIGLGV